jgi:hypothetical protein
VAGSLTGFVGFLTIFGGVSVALHLYPLTLETLGLLTTFDHFVPHPTPKCIVVNKNL